MVKEEVQKPNTGFLFNGNGLSEVAVTDFNPRRYFRKTGHVVVVVAWCVETGCIMIKCRFIVTCISVAALLFALTQDLMTSLGL